jgi:N-acetyl-gamma-glutamyl-phosphate reductase common form
MRVAVVGGAGFAGGELLRLLHGHPEVREIAAVSRSAAGRKLADVHPALVGTDAVFSGEPPVAVAAGADVVFLALEHGAAHAVAPEILASRCGVVCDLSADFRLQDETIHERFYGERPAASRAAAKEFVYALADLAGVELRGARALAVPGCLATAAQLALAPLARLTPSGVPAVFAVTGSSGAGAALKETTHHPLRAHNLFAYAPLAHRHDAEVAERWALWTGSKDAPRLAVHAGPFVRGIYLTVQARIGSPLEAVAGYRSFYARSRFVRVVDAPPHLTHVLGSNRADLFVAADDRADAIQVSIAIDNLIKGAAGQAIQAVNLALGLDEGAGVSSMGSFPC